MVFNSFGEKVFIYAQIKLIRKCGFRRIKGDLIVGTGPECAEDIEG
jgi:hypothetical protein